MTLRIASAEIVSILFLLIILGSSLHREDRKSSGHTFFVAMLITTMLGLGFDALAYFLDEVHTNSIILTITNILAFSTINLCIVSFSLYMVAIIRQTKDFPITFLYPVFAICTFDIIMIIIGSFNGRFLTITKQRIQYGPWTDLISMMPVFEVIIFCSFYL